MAGPNPNPPDVKVVFDPNTGISKNYFGGQGLPDGPGHDPLQLTPAQRADLIDHDLPERVVRWGKLDYASLTSGCMADRLRNGYA